MTVVQALVAFSLAAGLLTITPGLDTAIVLLAALHGVMGLAWFALLIGATRPLQGVLQRSAVIRWLDRLTGGVFLAFGVRLALERR